jgi:hypothetical protein
MPPPSPALEPARILDRIGMAVLDNQVIVSPVEVWDELEKNTGIINPDYA